MSDESPQQPEDLAHKKLRLEIAKLEKESKQFYPSPWFAFWQILFPFLTVLATAGILWRTNVFEINSKLIAIQKSELSNETSEFNKKKAAMYFTIDSLTGVANSLHDSVKIVLGQLKTNSDARNFERLKFSQQQQIFAKLKDENDILRVSIAYFVNRLKLVDQNLNQSAADLASVPPFLYSHPASVESVSNIVQRVHIRVNETERIVDSLRKNAQK